MLQDTVHAVFQCWCHPFHAVRVPPKVLYQGQHVPAHLCASNAQSIRWRSTQTLYSQDTQCIYEIRGLQEEYLLPIAYVSVANPSPRRESQSGRSNVLSLLMTNTTFPLRKGSRATSPAKWQSHMLTWLVPTLRPFVRLVPDKTPIRLPSSIGLMLLPTPTLSLAGEF